jgi:hypothetical protein
VRRAPEALALELYPMEPARVMAIEAPAAPQRLELGIVALKLERPRRIDRRLGHSREKAKTLAGSISFVY